MHGFLLFAPHLDVLQPHLDVLQPHLDVLQPHLNVLQQFEAIGYGITTPNCRRTRITGLPGAGRRCLRLKVKRKDMKGRHRPPDSTVRI